MEMRGRGLSQQKSFLIDRNKFVSVNEDKIENWVEEKLEEGYSEEDVKKILEKKGFDPDVVDRAHEILDNKNISQDSEVDDERYSENPESEPEEGHEEVAGYSYDEEVKTDESQLENIGGKVASSVEGNWKPGAEVILILSLLIAGAALIPFSDAVNIAEQKASDLTEMNKDDSKADTAETQETGESDIVLEGREPDPSRATARSGEEIVFLNNKDQTLTISFDSDQEDLTLEPGEKGSRSFTSITYYSAEPEGEGRELQGSVYVE